MQLQPIASSMIRAAGYEEATQTLEVMFNSGKVYRYFQVPAAVYDGLIAAPSKGRYMQDYVIDCYPCRQVARSRSDPQR